MGAFEFMVFLVAASLQIEIQIFYKHNWIAAHLHNKDLVLINWI